MEAEVNLIRDMCRKSIFVSFRNGRFRVKFQWTKYTHRKEIQWWACRAQLHATLAIHWAHHVLGWEMAQILESERSLLAYKFEKISIRLTLCSRYDENTTCFFAHANTLRRPPCESISCSQPQAMPCLSYFTCITFTR